MAVLYAIFGFTVGQLSSAIGMMVWNTRQHQKRMRELDPTFKASFTHDFWPR